MTYDKFDPRKVLNDVRATRAMKRRKKYRKSKLDRFRAEIVAIRKAGASLQDLAIWLRMRHRLKIHPTSIGRYLAGLPEMLPTGKGGE